MLVCVKFHVAKRDVYGMLTGFCWKRDFERRREGQMARAFVVGSQIAERGGASDSVCIWISNSIPSFIIAKIFQI